MICNYEKQAWW